MNKNETMAMMNCPLNGMSVNDYNMSAGTVGTIGNYCPTAWDYWQTYYYPQIIRESYPVWIQEKAQDKGKLAFELIKALQDKKLMKLEKVADFIEAMDTILKTL